LDHRFNPGVALDQCWLGVPIALVGRSSAPAGLGERLTERCAKLKTQSSSLLVVPLCRFGDITVSFWTKDEPLWINVSC
jgi:hypothetical protein